MTCIMPFREEELKVIAERPLQILAKISPLSSAPCSEQFVHVTLKMETNNAYPDEPATFTLVETKGKQLQTAYLAHKK